MIAKQEVLTHDEIVKAKEKYWESTEERLVKFPKRIDTVNRTAKEAHVENIYRKWLRTYHMHYGASQLKKDSRGRR